jgi:predicted nucleic acid-binding protein
MRVGVHEVALLDEFIAEFPIRIVPITPEIARRAASLRAGSTWLRLPDALVLATADVLEAPGVLTGDARWQGLSARVQVI